MIRVVLPAHLRALAFLSGELHVEVDGDVTTSSVLDAVETAHPVLIGRIRDPASRRRRPFVRFYACQEDLSHAPPDEPLPPAVVRGEEPFLVVGAMAGG